MLTMNLSTYFIFFVLHYGAVCSCFIAIERLCKSWRFLDKAFN